MAAVVYKFNTFNGRISGTPSDEFPPIPESSESPVISISSKEERDNYYTTENKKETNESFVEQDDVTRDRNIATQNASPTGSDRSEVMSYPFDLNPKQDHFKIMRYNYIRPDINMSKGPDQEIARVKGAQANKQKKYGNNQTGDRIINRAGDSVVGSELKGSVLLPMPKATDVNGAEWGKSELTISGIAALGAANMVAGRLANDDGQAMAEKEAREALNLSLIHISEPTRPY